MFPRCSAVPLVWTLARLRMVWMRSHMPLLWANRRVPFHFSEERMERNKEEWWKERLNNRLHIGALFHF